jgi:hypothetical protein
MSWRQTQTRVAASSNLPDNRSSGAVHRWLVVVAVVILKIELQNIPIRRAAEKEV